MAAGIFPTERDLFCETPCEHMDCSYGRRAWAARTCAICGELVEPRQRYYGWPIYTTERLGDLSHARCVELTVP